jgi:hypothetical protein
MGRKKRIKNRGTEEKRVDINSVKKASATTSADLRASSLASSCWFYRLQERLRQDGWYIEWTDATQAGHAWEDMPYTHQEGPYKGEEIDRDKCLISYLSDDLMSEIAARNCFDVSPESVGGNRFMFDPDRDARKNIDAILHIFQECGCRISYSRRSDEVLIEWNIGGRCVREKN